MHSDEYARVLEDPSRDAWQKPHEVITALAFKPEEVIADIGAGTGYFTRRFANHARSVIAVDIDSKLLGSLKANAPTNVATILASADDPKLKPQSVDTIFICNVLHHVEKRSAYLPKLRGALKPGGRIVVLEFHKRELPVGPPPSMKIEQSALIAEFSEAGFALAREHTFLPHQYFLEFTGK